MYKTYSNPVSVNEKKHETEVELCEMADFVVTVGPKLSEAFRSYLCGCKKDQMVFEFTPGLFAAFSDVKQVVDERKKFKVLVFGRGDKEDFELKGFDIAAKAVSMLDDTHLVFVGAPDGKQDEAKNRLLECGISAQCLTVRSFLQSRESLKKLLCEVDLAVMPSRTEAFGLTGLEALSAGPPILVSGNSGFGEALSKVPFGSSFVVDSDNANEWAKSIKNISGKDRVKRLKESKLLRMSYQEEYSWEKQSKSLISKMVNMTHDASVSCLSSTGRTVQIPQTAVKSKHPPGTLPIVITIDSVTYQKAKSGDPVQQEEAKRIIMTEMTKHFLRTRAADVPVDNYPLCLDYYLKGVLDLIIREAIEGSLRITVECSALEILERLWEDYSSGHFNAVVEECLLTDDIKKRFDVKSVKLETTILEEDYLACKLFLMGILQVNQDNELSPQDQIQAVDETQTQTADEPEPMTVHLAINYRDGFTDTQRDNRTQQQEDERQHLVSDGGSSVLEEETSDEDELPQYFQHLKVIPDSTTREESENSLRIAVECHNLESLERLWEDYHCGRLNAIAEKRLVTDDMKSRFHVKSVNLTTTILEEDYLACKEFLTNKTQSNHSSSITTSEELTIQATEETLIQSSEETQTRTTEESGILTSRTTQIQPLEETQSRVTDKSVTMTAQETVIQFLEETQTQAVDGSETLTAGNAYIPSATETRTQCVEDPKTQATAETHIPSHEEIQTHGIDECTNCPKEETEPQSGKKKPTQATEDMETLDTDQTRIPTAEGTWTQAVEILATEDIQIKDPEETRTQMEESESESGSESENERKTLTLEAKKSFNLTLDIEALKINTTLTRLDLRGKQIDDNGARSLAEVLKVNTTLTSLGVSENSIGPRGAKSIFEALVHNATLTNLNVSNNNIGEGGAYSLFTALEHNATLTNLNVSENNIGEGGAYSLFTALKHNATLTNLNVSNNNIGEGGAYSLFTALRHNATLINLNVSNNNIGEGGAFSLFTALRQNTTLTNLNVSNNNIGPSGADFLFSALEHNTTLTNLDVSNNDIGLSGADFLFSALEHNTTLTNLDVSNNNIGPSGADSLSSALEHNTTLTNLDVSNNDIGPSGADSLSSALEHNTTLTNLDVSNNNIGPSGADSLSSALEHNITLTNLDVSNNNIGPSGADSLSSALEHNTTLTNLDVSNNDIGLSGADSLSCALEHNTTLTYLNVSQNNIGERGADSLSKILQHNTTLTYLDVSNNNIGERGADSFFKILQHNTTLTVLNVSKNNADVEARSISRILEIRTTSRLNKPGKRKIADVDASPSGTKYARKRLEGESSESRMWKEVRLRVKRPYCSLKEQEL
ncbi:hypothetical protein ACROYT_G013999 [Oculina patagonica]